jgi:hypothetical protein
MSGPIFAAAQVASTNGPAGSGRSASFSTASKTAAGAAPSSGLHARCPATSADQRAAPACICSSDANSRLRQKLSRTYGIGRSTRALSRGLQRPGRVDEAAVMGGELGIGPVDLRVVEVGLVDPGLEVVRVMLPA